LTCSNYAALLTNRAHNERQVDWDIKAYPYYRQVLSRLNQVPPSQLATVQSSVAYGLIRLGQGVAAKAIIDKTLPPANQLFDQAEQLLQQALQHQPDHLNARLFHGVLLFEREQYPEALQSIEQVLCLNPQHPTGLRRKGFILAKLGRREEAIEVLTQAKACLAGKSDNTEFIAEIDEVLRTLRPKAKL